MNLFDLRRQEDGWRIYLSPKRSFQRYCPRGEINIDAQDFIGNVMQFLDRQKNILLLSGKINKNKKNVYLKNSRLCDKYLSANLLGF